MKDIFISYAGEDKKAARKLSTKLESENDLLCWVAPRDFSGTIRDAEKEKEAVENSRIFVLLLSKHALNSKITMRQLSTAMEVGVPVVPMKISSFPENVGLSYMLFNLEWVDAHGDGFDTAYEILLEIYEEYLQGKPIAKRVHRKPPAADSSQNINSKYVIAGLVVLMFFMAVWYFFIRDDNSKTNNTAQNNNTEKVQNNNLPSNAKPETVDVYYPPEDASPLAGTWRIVDYEDSRQMSAEERRNTQQNIEQLKKNALVIFRADGTFARTGFTPQPETGMWSYDPDKLLISLAPEGSEQAAQIGLLNQPDSLMTFVINERTADAAGNALDVTTRITLKKMIK